MQNLRWLVGFRSFVTVRMHIGTSLDGFRSPRRVPIRVVVRLDVDESSSFIIAGHLSTPWEEDAPSIGYPTTRIITDPYLAG